MLITKEQQEALINKYIKENKKSIDVISFAEGMQAMLELVSKLNK